MKVKVFCIMMLCLCIRFFAVESIDSDSDKEFIPTGKSKASSSFSIITEFAYYPFSQPIIGKDHFATVTGSYKGVEGRITGNFFYTIATPFGMHPLLQAAYVKLHAGIALTPITILPSASISFSPVAFLVFNAGLRVGSGWTAGPFRGIGILNKDTNRFVSQKEFSATYYYTYFGASLQFDLAAIVPGEWSHLVFVGYFEPGYEGLFYPHNNAIWFREEYYPEFPRANNWRHYSSFFLGYQMPIALQTLGLLVEVEGLYTSGALAQYANYNPYFTTISVGPMFVFEFTKQHSLAVQFRFQTRRSFTSLKDNSTEHYLNLTHSGTETFFERIALRYTYQF